MQTYRLLSVALAIPMAMAGASLAIGQDTIGQGQGMVLKDDQAALGTARISRLLGTDMYDPRGVDIGKVRDVVFDRQHDQVSYIVLSQRKGMMGETEKLVALPYKAMSYGSPAEDRVYVVLNRDILDQVPGFDNSAWPAHVDVDYYRSLDAYYNTNLASTLTPQEPEVTAQPAAAQLGPQELTWDHRATKLEGREVISPTGESLGKISDIVLEQKSGDVAYAALKDYRGNLHAVPLSAFAAQPGGDKKLVLNATREQLKATPPFDEKHWPSQPDPRWAKQSTTQPVIVR